MAMFESRHVLPSFVERTTYGVKETTPYNKLFEDRIIFLGVQVDDTSANDVMAQLLTLESTDPDRDISMYIDSPGGSFTAMRTRRRQSAMPPANGIVCHWSMAGFTYSTNGGSCGASVSTVMARSIPTAFTKPMTSPFNGLMPLRCAPRL
ncbi:ATP-dependent Clp endopeptidase, proteolytic subunit ClpP [Sinosporangium album]|uniref:ATP-dependent Clp protease proteolytic subunit n=1 Tax=Sinosporangium album TaxID=504805 RepID=A0A1G7QNC1_9ACTN|nr:ATP-dependent Clp endopeptidase, proteolytic subunit ClpP [Sinosporangium album]